MADTPPKQGTVFFPEVSGAEWLPGDRLLLASDEHGLRVVEDAADQLKSGRVRPEQDDALGRDADGFPLEDYEDACVDGEEFIYLLTSHARNRRGKAEKARYRLGRLRVKEGGGFADPRYSDGLWWALLTDLPSLAAASLRTPAAGGLNIEGMAVDRSAKCLLVGLRSPTATVAKKRDSKLQEDAVVLRVGKLDDLFGDEPHEPAKLLDAPAGSDDAPVDAGYRGKASLLDLGGHGIRGLCHDEKRKATWILSGLSTDPNHPIAQPFGLWLWDGKSAPLRAALPADLGLASPEALSLVPIDGHPHLLIVDDTEVDPSLLKDGKVDVDRLEAAGAGCKYALVPTKGLRV